MARKPKEILAATDPPIRAADNLPVVSVGTREFRNCIREICEAGQPVLVTRGRHIVGAFIPIKLPWFTGPKEINRERSRLEIIFRRVCQALRRE